MCYKMYMYIILPGVFFTIIELSPTPMYSVSMYVYMYVCICMHVLCMCIMQIQYVSMPLNPNSTHMVVGQLNYYPP